MILKTRLIKKRISAVYPYAILFTGILALSISAMFIRWAKAPGPITGFYRQLIAVIILFPFLIINRSGKNKFSFRKIIFPLLAGVSSGFDLGLWSTSLSYTSASNATLIGNIAPLWVALVGLIWLKERFRLNFWVGLSLALGGAFLIMGTDFFLHPRFGIGDLMALGTSFFYAGYYLATERGRKLLDPLSYTWLATLFAALTLLVINLCLGNQFTGYSAQTWIVFVSAAVVSQVIGYTALAYSLGHLPASIVSPTMFGQPVLTTILAIPLLGEVPHLLQAVGGLISLSGIYIVNKAHSDSAVNEIVTETTTNE